MGTIGRVVRRADDERWVRILVGNRVNVEWFGQENEWR